MKPISTLIAFFFLTIGAQAQTKAFVGGTLIDGFGGKPIYNSVIIVDNQRIKTVGTVATTPMSENLPVTSP